MTLRGTIVGIALALAAVACRGADARVPGGPTVITDARDRDAHVGETVILEGDVSATKLPQIAGVDVDESDDPRGKRARATGILRKTVVTRAELDAAIAEQGMFANRGAGTFYHLEQPQRGGSTRAVLVR